jgi:DNA-binding response OmpR family regulator
MSNLDDSQKSPPVIMIVDADPHTRNLAGHFLTEAGYKVEYAFDGKEALEKAKKNPLMQFCLKSLFLNSTG